MTRKPIGAVVFDFDGTLVLSNRIKHDAFYNTAEAHGLDRERVDALRKANPGASRHEIFAELSRQLGAEGRADVPDGPAFVATYAEIVTRAIARCASPRGAEATLDALTSRGIALFINSATPTDGLLPAVEARRMTGRFDAIYGGPASKLDNLLAIGSAAGLPPCRIVMVGDGDDDRTGAAAFGCHFVGIELDGQEHGRPAQPFAEQPAHLMSDLSELSMIVAAIEASESWFPS